MGLTYDKGDKKVKCKHPQGFQEWNGEGYVCYKCKELPNKHS